MPKLQSKEIWEQFHDAEGLREVSYPGGVVLIMVGGNLSRLGGKLTQRECFLSGPMNIIYFSI